MPWQNNRPTHVPRPLREAMLERDGHQCTATAEHTGRRCTETTNLEADEITRWYPGKRIALDDLRTLCHWHHNQHTQQQARASKKNSPPPTIRRPPEHHPGLR